MRFPHNSFLNSVSRNYGATKKRAPGSLESDLFAAPAIGCPLQPLRSFCHQPIGHVNGYCAMKRAIFSVKQACPSISHSQSTSTSQPASLSWVMVRSSRSLLRWIFSSQYSLLDFGFESSLQPWPCQKQPCTRIIFLCLGSTISGLPGKSLR